MTSKLDVKKLGELQFYLLHRDLCHVHINKALCGEFVKGGGYHTHSYINITNQQYKNSAQEITRLLKQSLSLSVIGFQL